MKCLRCNRELTAEEENQFCHVGYPDFYVRWFFRQRFCKELKNEMERLDKKARNDGTTGSNGLFCKACEQDFADAIDGPMAKFMEGLRGRHEPSREDIKRCLDQLIRKGSKIEIGSIMRGHLHRLAISRNFSVKQWEFFIVVQEDGKILLYRPNLELSDFASPEIFDCSGDPVPWIMGFGASDPGDEVLWSKVGPLAVFSVKKGLSLVGILRKMQAPIKRT